MRSNSVAKKRVLRAPAGPIIKLRWQDDVARRVFFLKAADRGHTYDPADVHRPERINVRPMIQLMRQQPMPAVVARQKINLPAVHRPTDEHTRRGAKRCFDPLLGRTLDTFHLIQPASADDPDCWRLITHARD